MFTQITRDKFQHGPKTLSFLYKNAQASENFPRRSASN